MTAATPDVQMPLSQRVRNAVFWKSGSQILAQLITWVSTFLVIRLLDPSDYGLFALTGVVIVFFNLLNGYGFASALIQQETIDRTQVRQAFGMLLVTNGALAIAQFALAPVAADYFRQPLLADLLRVQILLYLSTPFIALPYALLSREIDYRRLAFVNLAAALLGAATALALAYSGWGVWTLVWAPIVLFWARGIGLTAVAGSLVMPSFRFRGAGALARYGGAMMLTQFFWFVQSQADVFIAGRAFSTHEVGIYTTALFLAQILVSKFVPPLNDVAFAAYSRIQSDRAAIADAFAKAAGIVFIVALPFSLGLAVTAEPLVVTMLGNKWRETIPVVRLMALAMPFMTLQILFAPATNAVGRPATAIWTGAIGATLMPIAFLIALPWGVEGLGWAWLAAFPILTLVTVLLSARVIDVTTAALARAIAPPLAAALLMAGAVALIDAAAGTRLAAPARLALAVAAGGIVYALALWMIARERVLDLVRFLRERRAA